MEVEVHVEAPLGAQIHLGHGRPTRPPGVDSMRADVDVLVLRSDLRLGVQPTEREEALRAPNGTGGDLEVPPGDLEGAGEEERLERAGDVGLRVRLEVDPRGIRDARVPEDLVEAEVFALQRRDEHLRVQREGGRTTDAPRTTRSAGHRGAPPARRGRGPR